MMFGSSVHNLMALFAPGILAADPAAAWGEAHVAAVVCTGTFGVWEVAAGHLPFINRYVIGVAVKRDACADASGPSGDAVASCARLGGASCGVDFACDR